MNCISIITLPQNNHVRIAVSQTPLVSFKGFSLASNDIKLVLVIAFFVYKTQNVVYSLSPRYVPVLRSSLAPLPVFDLSP